MKNSNKILKVRWRCRRSIAYMLIISILSIMLALKVEKNLLDYTIKTEWIKCCLISLAVFIFIFVFILVIICIQAKKRIYYIYLESNICIKNKKKFYYTDYTYKQTTVQIIFDVVDIRFYNNQTNKSVLLKDVSKSVLYDVETSVKGEWKLAFFYWLCKKTVI